jgi:hypothetical protein
MHAYFAVVYYRGKFMERQAARGVVPRHVGRSARSCPDARWLAGVWADRAQAAKVKLERWKHHRAVMAAQRAKQARFRALYEKWRCIHEHEGAWNANTGNGYYGGLQMDMSFMSAYGREFIRRWGYAHNWPVWAQLTAAERAYHSGRGFGPWPNTRRMCGQ